MKNKYNIYKIDYENYILLFKQGNFYICLNNDAIIMNKVFNYKIIDTNGFIKIGFPLTSLCKVETDLTNKNINYVIINDKITNKYKFKNNHYLDYLSEKNYNRDFDRINSICKLLKDNINNENFEDILKKIERIVCKINY